MKCQLCGDEHDTKCQLIKAYEYYPILDTSGRPIIKRIEFVTFADMPSQPSTLLSLPTHTTRQ
jgi:hypothetical protein